MSLYVDCHCEEYCDEAISLYSRDCHVSRLSRDPRNDIGETSSGRYTPRNDIWETSSGRYTPRNDTGETSSGRYTPCNDIWVRI